MIKLKVQHNSSVPMHMHIDKPSLTAAQVNALIDAKMNELAAVAWTGLLSDLNSEWDMEIILDCGTMDFPLAELDKTILQ